ncbi:MAG: DNA polymerase III subunit beta [Caldilineaceae bacterium]|nr:DNA polymerase III subunit beta [Caldilineaceae bacterium]MCY4091626.1 DNA polymerase III subunit beta [Caldilineaceae bacterium]MDE0068854.1 DNA polymerase III subunit beta [Caldilineaceae bacterium]MDE0182604.1 DNA polymerase III subunit beta [Caldilineaceae bacterium]
MRVSCFQENLSKGLSIVGRAVSSRSTLPVLGNILLEAKDNQLRLAATNLEIGINCWVGATVDDEGAITVPSRLLAEFVNSLPAGKIDMELLVSKQTLRLRSANYDVNIKGIDAQEFPVIPTVDNGEGPEEAAETLEGRTIALETPGLTKMIDQVVFAAATDESRPTLTGVEVTFAQERLSLAATDGYRLSVRSIEVDEAFTEDMSVVVPARHLGELGRIIVDADEERPVQVTVTQARNQILFRVWGKGPENRGAFHQVDLVSQLIADRFPDYRAIIPKSNNTRTVVGKEALLQATRVAQLFARDNANIVRLKIESGDNGGVGNLHLSATSPEQGNSENELDAMVEGDELEIDFDVRFLIDVLSQIDEEQVVLETTQSNRPGTIRPVGLGDEEFLHVVMPMHPPR